MGWKEAYQEKADSQLKEWKAQIEQFMAHPVKARYAKAVDRERSVQRLNDVYRAAQTRVDELRTTSSDRWETVKGEVEQAMIDLKRVLDETGAGSVGETLQVQKNRDHIYEPFGRKD